MEERNLNTWEGFERELKELRRPREDVTESPGRVLLFRGQRNSRWLLNPTLERERERMLFRDYYRLVHRIHPQIETLMEKDWPIPEYPEVERLV